VRRYYESELTKGNIVLGFAGDITEDQALRIGARVVERLPDGAPAADTTPDPVMAPGRRLLFVDKPERTQTQILIGGLGTAANDPDHVALTVGNAVFGGTFTSRLMQEVRSNRGWSYGAYSRMGIDRHRQSFSMWTFPGAEDAAACLTLEIELLEMLVEAGVSEDETAFIKQYLVRSHAFDIDTANKRLHQALDVELLGLPADYYSAYAKKVSAVTAEGASAAVRARLSPKDLLVVVVGTADEILEKVKAAIPGIAQADVVSYEED
jgi:zinc protease